MDGGAGEGFLNVLRDSLFRVRARSGLKPESMREGEGGAGDDGRLAGRKNEGFLRACIIIAKEELFLLFDI